MHYAVCMNEYKHNPPFLLLKFRYSEKAAKFEKNHLLKIWRYSLTSNFKRKIFSNFVAFSEYPNFKRCPCGHVDVGTCPLQVLVATLTLSKKKGADHARSIMVSTPSFESYRRVCVNTFWFKRKCCKVSNMNLNVT